MTRLKIEGEDVERAFEFLGIAVALTLVQMIVLYILFAIELGGEYNMFKIYRGFFEKYLFPLDKLYFLFVAIMYRLIGDSYLSVLGFDNVFKLTFFTILIINFAFVFALKRGK
jgi:hypothetical protein